MPARINHKRKRSSPSTIDPSTHRPQSAILKTLHNAIDSANKICRSNIKFSGVPKSFTARRCANNSQAPYESTTSKDMVDLESPINSLPRSLQVIDNDIQGDKSSVNLNNLEKRTTSSHIESIDDDSDVELSDVDQQTNSCSNGPLTQDVFDDDDDSVDELHDHEDDVVVVDSPISQHFNECTLHSLHCHFCRERVEFDYASIPGKLSSLRDVDIPNNSTIIDQVQSIIDEHVKLINSKLDIVSSVKDNISAVHPSGDYMKLSDMYIKLADLHKEIFDINDECKTEVENMIKVYKSNTTSSALNTPCNVSEDEYITKMNGSTKLVSLLSSVTHASNKDCPDTTSIVAKGLAYVMAQNLFGYGTPTDSPFQAFSFPLITIFGQNYNNPSMYGNFATFDEVRASTPYLKYAKHLETIMSTLAKDTSLYICLDYFKNAVETNPDLLMVTDIDTFLGDGLADQEDGNITKAHQRWLGARELFFDSIREICTSSNVTQFASGDLGNVQAYQSFMESKDVLTQYNRGPVGVQTQFVVISQSPFNPIAVNKGFTVTNTYAPFHNTSTGATVYTYQCANCFEITERVSYTSEPNTSDYRKCSKCTVDVDNGGDTIGNALVTCVDYDPDLTQTTYNANWSKNDLREHIDYITSMGKDADKECFLKLACLLKDCLLLDSETLENSIIKSSLLGVISQKTIDRIVKEYNNDRQDNDRQDNDRRNAVKVLSCLWNNESKRDKTAFDVVAKSYYDRRTQCMADACKGVVSSNNWVVDDNGDHVMSAEEWTHDPSVLNNIVNSAGGTDSQSPPPASTTQDTTSQQEESTRDASQIASLFTCFDEEEISLINNNASLKDVLLKLYTHALVIDLGSHNNDFSKVSAKIEEIKREEIQDSTILYLNIKDNLNDYNELDSGNIVNICTNPYKFIRNVMNMVKKHMVEISCNVIDDF